MMGSIETPLRQNMANAAWEDELQASLRNSAFYTPSTAGYPDKIKRFADSSEKKAGAVVCPSSAEDISATILFARAHSLDLAVCGGGHSTGGASSTDGGVVIDLSNMRRVTVDPKSKTIKAQGGCLWEEVDAAGGRYGLATVGGTVNHTGVGGLTLGGGYGWLSGKYGLVIDNLLAVQLVLANGRIVTASASENPDLFWAARGAGASFGVAVEFTFQAFDQKNPIWAGILGFPAEKIDTVVSFANQVAERSHGECGMIVGITAPPPKHVSAIFTSVFYNGSEENGKAFFRPLLDAGPVLDTTSVIPYSSLNAILNPRLSHGNRKTTKGATFATPLSPKFVHRIVDEHSDLIRQLPEAAGTVVLMEFFATSKICEVPLSAMSFANRGEHQNVVIIPRWLDSKHDNLCREWARRLAALYTEEMERMKREDGIVMKVEGVGEYGNYDSLNEKAQNIFGGNYERLRGLKAEYDPDNVFCKSHLIVPAVKDQALTQSYL